MQWLLVIMIFDIEKGDFVPRNVMHKAFSTEEACNAVGRNFREVIPIPDGTKTFSVCLERTDFDDKRWKVLDVQ